MAEGSMKARSATLAKGLEILSFVGAQKRPVSLRDVMTGLGMTKPTAHRLLATLVDHGMIRYEAAEATYRLGMHSVRALAPGLAGRRSPGIGDGGDAEAARDDRRDRVARYPDA